MRLRIRTLQQSLPASVLERLPVVSKQPAVMVNRHYFMSPGNIQIEACLDKNVFYFGDQMAVNVVITNTCNRTVRKLKVFKNFSIFTSR